MNPDFITARNRPAGNCWRPVSLRPDAASILVVADDPELLKALGETIRRTVPSVVEAYDGWMALELAKLIRFDLVIADLSMAQKHGVETLIEFKQMHPLTRLLALCGGCGGMTAGNFQAIAHSLGIAHTLVKPFTTLELLTAISQARKWEE
jgi:CheY-like chemotaxis protein